MFQYNECLLLNTYFNYMGDVIYCSLIKTTILSITPDFRLSLPGYWKFYETTLFAALRIIQNPATTKTKLQNSQNIVTAL